MEFMVLLWLEVILLRLLSPTTATLEEQDGVSHTTGSTLDFAPRHTPLFWLREGYLVTLGAERVRLTGGVDMGVEGLGRGGKSRGESRRGKNLL